MVNVDPTVNAASDWAGSGLAYLTGRPEGAPDFSRAAVLAEARRVLVPGGRIALLGQDWDTLVIDSDQPELTRRIVHARADTIPHPRIARAYRNLLLDAGFHDVDIEVHTLALTGTAVLPVPVGHATVARQAGGITSDEAEGWISEQTRRAHDDRLLVAIPMFLATATR